MSRRIVIIGGGALGQSAAASLLRAAPDAEVCVIERDPSYAIASSALSCSSIRAQFSTPANIALSQFGWRHMNDLQDRLGHDALGLRAGSYLFLANGPGHAERLEARARIVEAAGSAVQRWSRAELAETYPWLNVSDVEGGWQTREGEGWFDGYALLQAYRAEARQRGAQQITGEVETITTRGGRVSGVRLASGEAIEADQVLIAAGAWSYEVGVSVGLELPVRRRRRSVFIFDTPNRIEELPVLVDGDGVFVRRDADRYLTILSPEPDNDPDDLPLDPDLDAFEQLVWPMLAARVPAFEELRVTRAWAGYYEFNPIDHNGLVGQVGPDGLYVTAGFSGHGLQHSAGVGRGIAELMLDGGFRTLDLTPLRPSRFAEGEPIREEAVL